MVIKLKCSIATKLGLGEAEYFNLETFNSDLDENDDETDKNTLIEFEIDKSNDRSNLPKLLLIIKKFRY